MAYQVTNDSARTKAVKVPGGSVDVMPGKTVKVEAEFDADYIADMGKLGVTITKPKRGPKPAKKD